MKKLSPILILSLLFLSIGFSQQEYNSNDLIEMDNGLYTVKFSDEPITGKVYDYFEEFKPYSGAIILFNSQIFAIYDTTFEKIVQSI